jgi:hypothetical protein
LAQHHCVCDALPHPGRDVTLPAVENLPTHRRRDAVVGGCVLGLAATSVAFAHGEAPRVVRIEHPPVLGAAALLVTDTQGLFALGGDVPRWVCEDAVAPNAGLAGVVVGPAPEEWLVAASTGLFRSRDGGCTFEAVTGLPAGVGVAGPSAHPARPAERVAASTEAPGGLWFSDDAGASWVPSDVPGRPRLRSLLRITEAPERVYAAGPDGLWRSDDGGRRFAALPAGGALEGVNPESVYLVAQGGRPGAPDEVWVAVQRVPESLLLRSRDRGETFERVHDLPDPIDSVVFDAAGERAMVSTIFGTFSRSGPGLVGFLDAPAPGPGFGCLVRGPAPADDVIWGCADAFQGAPFTVATTEDFGETWQTVLSALSEVEHRWACDGATPAAQACADLCPGRPPGVACALCDAPACRADAGVDATVVDDVGVAPADATPVPPAPSGPDVGVVGPSPGVTVREGTCSALASGRGAPCWSTALALGLIHRRRRRRPGSKARTEATGTLHTPTERTPP